MKIRVNSEKSYDELQNILIQYEDSGRTISIAPDIVKLLEKYENQLRQKDGTAFSLQGSFATSRKDTYVVGIRYIKKDNTYTEDHFIFEKDKNLKVCKDRELEKELPEYRGAHK